MTEKLLPPWEEVLSAACLLQRILPDAVLVGGTTASLYAKHRFSRDADAGSRPSRPANVRRALIL
ncbi:hypothetical protein [Bradyrhizobium sp. Rc2d]|uniref:hypothetical protein n=1 Tax=Bradyrhizobium sp. Rc2d TaxID=1855321 RepID=UPI0015A1164A|nr:hypothetical protein [Bradyrhizobium sp. Rc2d]